jgi:hypothetical protein
MAPLVRTVGGLVIKSSPAKLPKYHLVASFCEKTISGIMQVSIKRDLGINLFYDKIRSFIDKLMGNLPVLLCSCANMF